MDAAEDGSSVSQFENPYEQLLNELGDCADDMSSDEDEVIIKATSTGRASAGPKSQAPVKALKELAAERIAQDYLTDSSLAASVERLPAETRSIVRRAAFSRKIAKIEDPALRGPRGMWWSAGLNKVISEKCRHMLRVREYAHGGRRGVFPLIPYMMHYLRQEPDFEERYPQDIIHFIDNLTNLTLYNIE